MVDTISKLLCVVLVFLMLIVAPLLISYTIDDAVARRQIMLEVTLFIDKIRDTRSVTQGELDQLYAACNSHGIIVDVQVRRLIKYVRVDNDGLTVVDYFATDEMRSMQGFSAGDGIQVRVTEIGASPGRTYMHSVFGADRGPLDFTLAGIVG